MPTDRCDFEREIARRAAPLSPSRRKSIEWAFWLQKLCAGLTENDLNAIWAAMGIKSAQGQDGGNYILDS